MPFAGVDAHKRYSRIVVKDETGSILCRASLQNDVAAFQGFFSNIDGPTMVPPRRCWRPAGTGESSTISWKV